MKRDDGDDLEEDEGANVVIDGDYDSEDISDIGMEDEEPVRRVVNQVVGAKRRGL